MRVYDNFDDIDTTELVDGEIVSTKEDAAHGSNIYDYVQQLVLDRSNKDNLLSDEETVSFATETVMSYDGVAYVTWSLNTNVVAGFKLNGVKYTQGMTYIGYASCAIPFKKGDTLQIINATTTNVRYYNQRYYGGRN